MAVQAQFAGGLAGCLPCGGGLADEQMRAVWDYGALLSATGKGGYPCAAAVVSAAQSELTCNGGGGVALPSRKRGRDAELDQYVSSAALLPIPSFVPQQPAAAACRMVSSATASTSRRAAVDASAADALASELGVEVDALVRAECERLRAGLEHARKRQCRELARVAARMLREKEAEVQAARRRAAELEERVRQAAAESQAWLGVARSNEAVAAGLRATLDHVLLRAASAGGAGAPVVEGFGESDPAAASSPVAAADDAQSCCFVSTDAPVDTTAAATSPAAKWACKACGEREATVLLLPCRHLCLCKACEPRADACPACLAAKNASIHVAPN